MNLKNLRHRVALYIFNHYFSNFLYGFEKADRMIEKLPQNQKIYYFEEVTSWVNSKAYEIENKGLINQIYEELATKAVGEDILTAYRLALLLLKSQDIRLRQKAQEYKDSQVIKKSYSNLK